MMKTVPQPKKRYELSLRSIMSAGESLGETVFRMEPRSARGHRQRDVRPDRDQLHRRKFAHPVAGQAGSIGRPYPGHRVACIDETGDKFPVVDRRVAAWTKTIRCSFSNTGESRGDQKEIHRQMVRTGDLAKRDEDGDFCTGAHRRHVQERGLPHRSFGDRELPGEASGGRERRGRRQPDPERTHIVRHSS